MDSSSPLSPEEIILLHGGGALTPPAPREPAKEKLRLVGPHSVKPNTPTLSAVPMVSSPPREVLRPTTSTSAAVTRTLVGPHSIETREISQEEKKIRELHEMGQALDIILWDTGHEAALNPEHERFQMYNQLSLLDDGTLILTEIKPGAEFTRTLQIDPERILLQKSELVAAIRGHIKQAGFEWNKKPE